MAEPEALRPYDTRALTDDQRSLADDIASAMGWGHERTCAVWREDADGCSCPLLQAVADGLEGARVVEVIQEWGYDPATQRGERLHRQPFRPHPLSEAAVRGSTGAPNVEVLTRVLWNMSPKIGAWLREDMDTHELAEAIASEYRRLR